MEPFVAEYLSYLGRTNDWLFKRLLEYASSTECWGKINIVLLFNAYQPRANRAYKEHRPAASPP